MTEPIRILIIAPSGRISDSLRVLLRAGCRIAIVGQATDSEAGVHMAAELSPGLALLSTRLPGGAVWPLLERLRRQWPQIRCCVLAQNVAEEHRAKQMGAYAVLQNGFAAEDLYRIVETVKIKQ